MRNLTIGTAIGCTLMLGTPTSAQQQSSPTPPPPSPQTSPRCDDEAFRAFDFWIGEWEVRSSSGQLAGHNSIQPIADGCGLMEQYSQGGNPAGQSLNYYDQARHTWGQTWISPGIVILMEGAPTSDGVMAMSGTITYRNQPTTRGFSARWSLQDDGTVRQQFWEQNAETGEWSDWFTGIYTRSD